MASPPSPETRLALARAGEARERVIAALQEHFAHDALDVDELERRVTLAHQSQSASEIAGLLADLPVVPPGLAVETEGSAIMGSFEHVDRAPHNPDPEAPLLRVRGLVFMGSVEISMRLPGETARAARRRLHGEEREGKGAPKALPER